MPRVLSDQDKWILEQLFQRMRKLYLEKHVLISREEFAQMSFPVVTSCWGLLGIIKGKESFDLIPESRPHANGLPRGPRIKITG